MNSILGSALSLSTRTVWKFSQQHQLRAGPQWIASVRVFYITRKTAHSKVDKFPSLNVKKTKGMSSPTSLLWNLLMTLSPAPVVYTDGSCLGGGRRGAKAGYGVFWGNGHPDNLSAPVYGTATSSRAELLGAVDAIRQSVHRGDKRLTLCTDSLEVIHAATKHMPDWKRGGWKKGGRPVRDVDLLKTLDVLLSKIEVTWKYVRGHSGIHGNEIADRLAREGAKKYGKVHYTPPFSKPHKIRSILRFYSVPLP